MMLVGGFSDSKFVSKRLKLGIKFGLFALKYAICPEQAEPRSKPNNDYCSATKGSKY